MMKIAPLLSALAIVLAGCATGHNAVVSNPAAVAATGPSVSSSGPPPSRDGKVHLQIYVGLNARPERIKVLASLGRQIDRAAIAKARASYVATPMSVQIITFSP